MPNDAIFLVSDSGELQRVEHQLYASEDILQQLVARHPDLLAGDQIDPSAPPRWLLIRREATIPDSADGPDRWWLDHLLLDQFGVPTLVEVKRSSDTRIRREVVGQMLDYVANAQAYWAAGRMRQMLADELGSAEAADSRLAEYLGVDRSADTVPKELEAFWHKVEANMRDGNVRLLFVADELPRELKRLIEFLNEQFTKIEVLGVELRQYVGQGIKALVPRVVGQTEAAREQKERSSPRSSAAGSVPLSEEQFFSDRDSAVVPFFRSLLDETKRRGLQVTWTARGFNVRKPGYPKFLYVYVQGSNRRLHDQIEIYVGEVPDSLRTAVKEEFVHIPSAIARGDHTIQFDITVDNMPNAQQALAASFRIIEAQKS